MEQLALWRFDARGRLRLTPFGWLTIALTVFVLIAIVGSITTRLTERLGRVAEDFAGQAVGAPTTFPITGTAQLVRAPDSHEYYAAVPPDVAEQIKKWTMKTSLTWNTGMGRWLAYHDASGEKP